jgi:hypothetical protein
LANPAPKLRSGGSILDHGFVAVPLRSMNDYQPERPASFNLAEFETGVSGK